MPDLATITEALEVELTGLITSAWGVSKIATTPREKETTLAALPEAYLILTGAEPDDEEGAICSESARLQFSIILHAKKPAAGSVFSKEKRDQAQALRSAIKAHAFTSSSDVRWEGEQYDAREDSEVEAMSGAYMLRVRFSAFVEWED